MSPPKFKFLKQTHSKEQHLFAGPCPIINPSGNFRRGHCAGYPWGLTFWVAPWLHKLFYKHYIIKFINIIEKFINIIEKLINPIVIPQKHDNYTRKVLYGIGEGGGGGGKLVYKDSSRSKTSLKDLQKSLLTVCFISWRIVSNSLLSPSFRAPTPPCPYSATVSRSLF